MRTQADVIVVGAGVGGSALAAVLARNGLEVLVLERTAEHRDRVRGEYLAPWGVAETQSLGVYRALLEAGAHHTTQTIQYSEEVPPDLARRIDLTSVCPGVPGALCVQHVAMCNALNALATSAGAEMIRPVERVEVRARAAPEVRFVHAGRQHHVRCLLVLGADGRGSTLARQVGVGVQNDPPHHFLAGLLVEGVEGWPEKTQTIGVEGNVTFYVFPQGQGRARLYLGYGRDQGRRFAGPRSAEHFLEAFRLSSVPGSEVLAGATPAGPCHGYPNEDAWSDDPVAPGVVLIGDAAGHNDPSIGQGLSITFRDARLVSEIMLSTRNWSNGSFRSYVEERRERMRRLRFVGRLFSKLRAEYDDAARARRQRARERLAADPTVARPLAAMLAGPEALPKEAFEQAAWERLIG